MSDKTAKIPEDDIYEVYSLLSDATEAAATGNPNECASKASDAKEALAELHTEYYYDE